MNRTSSPNRPGLTRTVCVFIALAFASACSNAGIQDDPIEERRALTAVETAVVESDNEFGLGLFRRLAADVGDANLFISPLSISTALGLTANGAAGATRDSMIATLGKAGLDREAVNRSYHDLTQLLSGVDPKVTVEIANSVWPRQGVTLVPSFTTAATDWFDAHVEPLDFTRPESVDRINGWASDKTHGMIPTVLDGLDSAAMMVLMNAVYFKGTWKTRFDAADTHDAPFHNADSTISTVPLMTLEATLPVARTERFSAFDLAYGDSLYSMTVVLPNEGIAASDLVADLTSERWTEWTADLAASDVRVYLPRFKTAYKESLVAPLTDLGMGIAFDGGLADFSNLVEGGGIWIGDVLHQAVVDVNEEGTEAAAVTTVVMVTSIGGSDIRVDRPFIFVIRERLSGALLFLGLIQNLD